MPGMGDPAAGGMPGMGPNDPMGGAMPGMGDPAAPGGMPGAMGPNDPMNPGGAMPGMNDPAPGGMGLILDLLLEECLDLELLLDHGMPGSWTCTWINGLDPGPAPAMPGSWTCTCNA